MSSTLHFEEVTLLITHYNRSRSLERLLKGFADLNISFGDIVVSDDCSKPEHLQFIETLHNQYDFRLIGTEKNKGLGNNINKGQNVVRTPFTLYVQEDFLPLPPFVEHFIDGVDFIKQRQDIDLVRFYAYYLYPYIKPVGKGFSEMVFSIWKPGTDKFCAYSDHPHLRRADFFEKFGAYPEGRKSDETEFMMMMSFLRKKGKVLIYNNVKELFDQINSASEPSTVHRNFWRNSDRFPLPQMRLFWRFIKFNFAYFFGR